jgi:hypothetical protein
MPASWDPAKLPNLTDGAYSITSCYDTRYNCIAWAAGATTAWWQPENDYGTYWPDGAPTENIIESYVAAFGTLGYVECSDASLEEGWEKVALFGQVEDDKIVCPHAARQLPDGTWTSKLGNCEDITHMTLEVVHCDAYGIDFLYMKRPRAKPVCD